MSPGNTMIVERIRGVRWKWKVEALRARLTHHVPMPEAGETFGATLVENYRDFCNTHSSSQFTKSSIKMAPKKKVERPQENVSLGPQVREGELVFGVARIFASKWANHSPQNCANRLPGFNDTWVLLLRSRKNL
jgi:hypothetical protein